jgi:hypothetical protein
LRTESGSLASPLIVGSQSLISLALVPKEDISTLPQLCAYSWDGDTLRTWPVDYQLRSGGTMILRSEIRDLLHDGGRVPQELWFVVSGTLQLCHPLGARAIAALDAPVELLLGHPLTRLLGMTRVRVPIAIETAP